MVRTAGYSLLDRRRNGNRKLEPRSSSP